MILSSTSSKAKNTPISQSYPLDYRATPPPPRVASSQMDRRPSIYPPTLQKSIELAACTGCLRYRHRTPTRQSLSYPQLAIQRIQDMILVSIDG
jgi:hypothetical protein